MMSGQPYARLNNFHGPKRQLLGNHAGHAAPAWKTNAPLQSAGKGKQVLETGSKIFLSRLPLDVSEKEVEELFRKTVGPLKEYFLIYNSQGKSKGMAVVTFQRSGDATFAKAKYDGKIVDGRRPLKIEIITDSSSNTPMAPPQPTVPALLNRMTTPNQPIQPQPVAHGAPPPKQFRAQNTHPQRTTQMLPTLTIIPTAVVPVPPRRVRQKKGPKRIKKLQRPAATIDQLDKEIDDYRAAADV